MTAIARACIKRYREYEQVRIPPPPAKINNLLHPSRRYFAQGVDASGTRKKGQAIRRHHVRFRDHLKRQS